MPIRSKAQQGYMFKFHPEIAARWAKETPDMKDLPEHVEKKKKILKKYTGKGGVGDSSYSQASTPINLLKTTGEPPTVKAIPKSSNN